MRRLVGGSGALFDRARCCGTRAETCTKAGLPKPYSVAAFAIGALAAARPKKKLVCPAHRYLSKVKVMTSPSCSADFTPTVPSPPWVTTKTSAGVLATYGNLVTGPKLTTSPTVHSVKPAPWVRSTRYR